MATGLSNGGGLAATGASLILGARGLVDGPGLSAGNGLGGGGGGLSIDFGTGVLPASVAFTRASAAWGFNSVGVLTSFAINQPRFVYDPLTLANLGLMVEGARTNGIPNSTAVGAVPGSPGTMPNLWGSSTANVNSLTRTVVGSGVEDGIEYVDVRYSGTPDTSNAIFIFVMGTQAAAAASGQIWVGSFFLRLMGGSFTNLGSPSVYITENNAAGSGLVSTAAAMTATSTPLRTQRSTVVRTLNNASTAFVQTYIRLDYALGNAIDITLRIGLPQLELGYHASSPIKTSTVAVTRAIDLALITDARALTDAAVIVRGRTCITLPPAAGNQHVFARDAGADATTMKCYRDVTPAMFWRCDNAGNQANLNLGTSVGANTDFAVAGRFATNDVAASLNGAAVVTDVTANIPVVTTFRIGKGATLGGEAFGTFRSIETRATASDAELQALSRLTPEGTYDFSTGSLPTGVSFTRTSTAWGFDRNGTLQSYATDAPRFVYDPVTLANLGLLVEGARTNSIRNNTAVGAVAGTPGTLPTNWLIGGVSTGLTRTVVGTGTEDGIDYVDIQYAGTPPASTLLTIEPETRTGITAASGQVWTSSFFVRLVGGSLTNTSVQLVINELTAAGASIGGATTTGSVITLTSAALRTQRSTLTRTLTDATTGCINGTIRVNQTISLPIDITLRIGLPQLELGSDGVVTSPIKTSTVAITRAVDTANITDPRVLTDQCLIARARTASSVGLSSNHQAFVALDDGTTSNRKVLWRGGVSGGAVVSGGATLRSDVGAVAQAILDMGAPGNNVDVAVAGRYAFNSYAASLNGGAVNTTIIGAPSSTGLVPVVTNARIGRMSNGFYLQSTIKSIETRATASDAELQALSGVP